MCYSRDWDTNEKRKRQEADAGEAERKRQDMIKTLLTDGEKAAAAKAETVPAKEPALSK